MFIVAIFQYVYMFGLNLNQDFKQKNNIRLAKRQWATDLNKSHYIHDVFVFGEWEQYHNLFAGAEPLFKCDRQGLRVLYEDENNFSIFSSTCVETYHNVKATKR